MNVYHLFKIIYIVRLKSESKAGNIFDDLGIDKEKRFSYPWNPTKSPIFCEDAKEFETTEFEYYKNNEPTEACNEFIFTRQ